MNASDQTGIHFFEVFTVANFALIAGLLFNLTIGPFVTIPLMFVTVTLPLVIQLAAGIAVRLIVARLRGDRSYRTTISSPEWIGGTLRILLAGSLMVHTYAWIKTAVPRLHPVLYDQALWNVDRALCFGLSPNILALNLFSSPASVLRVIDWTYANIFVSTFFVAFAYVLSDPRDLVRNAFTNGNAILWLAGAWLYVLVPSLGPAYRFPEIWMRFAPVMKTTIELQGMLFHARQHLAASPHLDLDNSLELLLGIAAFPSLHVGFQTFVALWVRRVWRRGFGLFAFLTLAILLGSLVTGWHYLIDGIAGAALAWVAYFVTTRGLELPEEA